MSEHRYPLGTNQDEFERLAFQHRLWSDAAHTLWRRAGIQPGSRVLDVGAGPGAASFDLAALVGSKGRVVAIDASEGFAQYVGAEASRRGQAQLEARVGDVQALSAVRDVPRASFDAAYARWVLCFTPRPGDVLAGVADLLAPGGRFCIHDYFNYEAMTAAPRRASYDKVVRAGARSWREAGGDPDVVARLPALLRDAGFELVHLDVHQRLARPGDTMWQWVSTWWKSYAPKLVTMGFLETADVDAFLRDFDAMNAADDFVVLPAVYELMAVKR